MIQRLGVSLSTVRRHGQAAAVAIGLALAHAFVFPPAGFFTGDQGPKYLQALAFAENGPRSPDIAVLSRDLDTRLEFQDPILHENRGRLIAAFNWLLPLATAPFLWVFGLRGLYVVPALSTIVIFVAARHLGRTLGLGDGRWSAWTAVVATPVLFYGAELWEHAPAAAGVMAAAALLAPERSPAEGGRHAARRYAVRRHVAAGASIAVAALFREEAALALPALLVARTIAEWRRGLKIAPWILASLGAAAVFLATLPMNAVLHGSVLPLHLTAEIGKSQAYFMVRREAIEEMVLPRPGGGIFAAVVAVLFAAAIATRRAPPAIRVTLAHAGAIALLLSMSIVPLWRLAFGGAPPLEGFSMSSGAHTWLFCLPFAYYALLAKAGVRPDVARFLIVGALALFAATLAVVPSFGGAQWSPRYLLAAAPLLAVLAPAPLWTSSALAAGHARWVRRAVCALLALAVVVQLEGLWALGSAKARNARITETTARLTTPDEVVISVVAWFPEVTATLLRSRRIMFVRSAGQVTDIAGRAEAHGLRRLAIVTHPDVPYVVPLEIATRAGGCRFIRVGPTEPLGRGLELLRYTCGE